MMMGAVSSMGTAAFEGERALAELAGALAALDPASIVRPGTDPHAAAGDKDRVEAGDDAAAGV